MIDEKEISKVNILLEYNRIRYKLHNVVFAIAVICGFSGMLDGEEYKVLSFLGILLIVCSIIILLDDNIQKVKNRYIKINYKGLNHLYYDNRYNKLLFIDKTLFSESLKNLTDKDDFEYVLFKLVNRYLRENSYESVIKFRNRMKTYTVED